ncbi:hypothetical protein BGZ93_010265, partial [Podila epicladia]
PRARKLIMATKETSKATIVARPSRHGHRRHTGGDKRRIVPDPNIIQEQKFIPIGPRIVRYEDLFPNKVIVTKEVSMVGKNNLS